MAYHRMQSMNQSLAALVLNGLITREAALGASNNPNDLDLLLRKFFFASEQGDPAQGDSMAPPLSDYSKIVELQEIRKLYDEQHERHAAELAEKDTEIERLRAELDLQTTSSSGSEVDALRAETERLTRQLEHLRHEYEARVERLNSRIRELSGPALPVPEAENSRKGFFRR